MKPQEKPTVSKTETVQTLKQVDFNRDIAPLLPVMIGAYEKANIHAPYRDSEEASEILSRETEEAFEEVRKIDEMPINKDEDYSLKALNKTDLQAIEAHAMSGICELLQVIAACKKYTQMLEREEKEVKQ